MIDVEMTAAGIAIGCLLIGAVIWGMQSRVRSEIALGQEFIAQKRAMNPIQTEDDLRREINTLKAELAIIDVSRQDLFNYLLQLEKTVQKTTR